jgi:hypothetical protein
MQRNAEMGALTPEQIELVAGGTSLSPEQLAKGRATIKGTNGTPPEDAAGFLGKFIMGLVRL